MPDNNDEIESGTAETVAQVGAERNPLELYDAQRRRRDETELNRPMTKREAQRIIDAIEDVIGDDRVHHTDRAAGVVLDLVRHQSLQGPRAALKVQRHTPVCPRFEVGISARFKVWTSEGAETV